jgi:Na+/H+ antiporter NhaA
VALLMVDRSFANAADASVAKIAVLAGSAAAALLGSAVLFSTRQHTLRSEAA